jgi:hypothetical protein
VIGCHGDLSQQQQPSLLSEILPENQRFSARAVRYNEMPAVVGSDVSLSPSTKNKGRAAAYLVVCHEDVIVKAHHVINHVMIMMRQM